MIGSKTSSCSTVWRDGDISKMYSDKALGTRAGRRVYPASCITVYAIHADIKGVQDFPKMSKLQKTASDTR